MTVIRAIDNLEEEELVTSVAGTNDSDPVSRTWYFHNEFNDIVKQWKKNSG